MWRLSAEAFAKAIHAELSCGASLHWSDLHRMLYDALPTGIVKQAHSITAFQQHTNRVRVTVEQRADSSLPATFEVEADLLVAADGANSTVRKLLRPDDRRR